MLERNRRVLLERLDDEDLVLDVGGGFHPFPRADWVIDLTPYERRGVYGGPIDPSAERFDERTWVVRDICLHEPWPFDDKQFDFVVCSHTLEDVRDPIWVCHELIRVAKAGYIEVPSRLEEQSFGFQGPWVGWGHHRWLIDVAEDEITFVLKHHVIHGRDSDHFNVDFHPQLTAEQRVQWLWWTGEFLYRERILWNAEDVDSYLSRFVAAHRSPPPPGRRMARARRGLRRLSRR